jgi:hypothetical protein
MEIMKFHVFAQGELPHRWAFELPRAGQRRHQFQIFAARNHRLKHVVQKCKLHRFIERMRIKRKHIALIGYAYHHTLGGDRTRRSAQERGEKLFDICCHCIYPKQNTTIHPRLYIAPGAIPAAQFCTKKDQNCAAGIKQTS